MKNKEKVKRITGVIAAVILFCVAIAILIFLFRKGDVIINIPENPTGQVTESSDLSSPTYTRQYTPIEGLNRYLPRKNNPQNVTLTADKIKVINDMFNSTVDNDATVYISFPDSSVACYENDKFNLNTAIFHEKHNYIATVTIISDSIIKSGYLLADRDGTIYMDEIKKSTMKHDVSLRIINRDNPITQAEANDTTGLIQLKDKNYVLDNRDDLFILPHVKQALEELLVAADKQDASLKMYVASAHRTYDSQKQSFDYWVNRRVTQENMTYAQAYEYTAGRVAIPGCSEHHNGLTLDVVGYGYMMDESSKGAPYAIWLKNNSYKYGFTVRYEEGKEQYTKITLYEPWHLRYVGLPTAFYLYNENLCMEEFYQKLLTEKLIDFTYDNETYRYIYAKNDNIYIDENVMETVQYSRIASNVEGYVVLCKVK